MASPSYWGQLVAFQSSLRKPMLVPFGLFNPQDNLGFIASAPGGGNSLSQASVPFAAALAIDTSLANVITVLLTGNVTSMKLNYNKSTTIPNGQQNWLRLLQDGTGNRTVALPASLITDTGFAVDPGANRATVLPIQWNGTHWIFFTAPFSVPTA